MNHHQVTQTTRKRILSVVGLEHELRDRNSGGRFLIRVPELDIEQGQFIALMGPTGVGKTTLLQILALLRQPTRVDKFTLLDTGSPDHTPIRHDVRKHWQQGRQREIELLRSQILGYVPQQSQLLPALSVAENVEIPLRLNRVQGIGQRVHELLGVLSHADPQGRFDLLLRTAHRPHEISGGQSQRVCIARAVAHHPMLLFADEPTSCLDPLTAHCVMQFFTELRRQQTTIVMVTHDEDLANDFADRVIRLGLVGQDTGSVVADEPIGALAASASKDNGALESAVCFQSATNISCK